MCKWNHISNSLYTENKIINSIFHVVMFENLHSGLYCAMINKFTIILCNSFYCIKKFYCISNIYLRTNGLNYQSLRRLPGLKTAENDNFYEFFERKNGYCCQFHICTHIFISKNIHEFWYTKTIWNSRGIYKDSRRVRTDLVKWLTLQIHCIFLFLVFTIDLLFNRRIPEP